MTDLVAKFGRTLDLFYQLMEQSDTDLTMLDLAKMSSAAMYAYLEKMGYIYDESKRDWRLLDEPKI